MRGSKAATVGGKLGALLATLAVGTSCASSPPQPARCKHSEFSASEELAAPPRALRALFAGQAPPDAVCSLKTSGFQNRDHGVFVVRDRTSRSVVVLVQGESGIPTRFEAPLDEKIGSMLERICVASLERRANCRVGGIDGDWHYLEANIGSGTRLAALTWSPASGTESDAVIDVFVAMRAYASAPASLRRVALNTLYTKTYATHAKLGLLAHQSPE